MSGAQCANGCGLARQHRRRVTSGTWLADSESRACDISASIRSQQIQRMIGLAQELVHAQLAQLGDVRFQNGGTADDDRLRRLFALDPATDLDAREERQIKIEQDHCKRPMLANRPTPCDPSAASTTSKPSDRKNWAIRPRRRCSSSTNRSFPARFPPMAFSRSKQCCDAWPS